MAPLANANRRKRVGVRTILRYGSIVVAVCATLAGGIYASQQFEQFMIRDPRFFLPGPPDYGVESPNLEVQGVRFASRAHILGPFDRDYGRSLYLFPLPERRKGVLNVRWVRDASIERIWPNRVLVRVTERQPAAFVQLPGAGMARWALIDEDGVILDPPPKVPFHLPVLAGVLPGETLMKRGIRVRRMLHLMKDLGGLPEHVSEVDAATLDNLKIVEHVEGNAVTLLIADRKFSTRLRN